ncbi:hypothetical protein [Actinocorallia lasiicapitis]
MPTYPNGVPAHPAPSAFGRALDRARELRYWFAITLAVLNALAGAVLILQGESAQALPMIALVGAMISVANITVPERSPAACCPGWEAWR